MSLDLHINTALGSDLRALRKARQLTLETVAEDLGKSVGWLSQVERDISTPAMPDLRKMAALYEVPLTLLTAAPAPPDEQGRIVRAANRRPMGDATGGLVEELLSPDLTDEFEVIHSTFAPGATLSEDTSRPTQEIGYLISGQFQIWIDGTRFDITPGDSFRIRGERYRWAVPGDTPAVLIWVIAPPVY